QWSDQPRGFQRWWQLAIAFRETPMRRSHVLVRFPLRDIVTNQALPYRPPSSNLIQRLAKAVQRKYGSRRLAYAHELAQHPRHFLVQFKRKNVAVLRIVPQMTSSFDAS